MRTGRYEIFLIAGLLLALSVVFSGQTVKVLQATREFERTYGLGLLPGFTLGAVTLVVYFQGKRRQLQARATSASAAASRAQERAQELERLITFWHALTQSFDLDAIADVARHYLPELSGGVEAWVVVGREGRWQSVLGPATVTVDGVEWATTDIATAALARAGLAARPDGVEHGGQLCFPMIAAGSSLGVIGLSAGLSGLPQVRRLVMGAAAALMAVSVRSVQLLEEVRENTLRDPLTGCINRGHAMEVIAAELMRARRSRRPVSMIMFDVDRFKQVNDRFGHLAGDAVLTEVGARTRAALRGSDLKCRYGGEEFLVLLPETPLEGAVQVAEGLRRDLASIAVQWNDTTISVTSSFGVATAGPHELDPTSLIARTDEALYRAKREGRDCVRVADPPAASGPQPILPALAAVRTLLDERDRPGGPAAIS